MTRQMEYRCTYECSARRVYEALIDPDVLRERLRVLSGENELAEHAVTERGARFEVRQGVRAEVIPSVARTVVGQGVTIHRTESWRLEDEGRYGGEVVAGVPGMPRSITGSMWLRDLPSPEGPQGSEFVVEASVKVGIPFIGAKLEALFADEVQTLLVDEQRFTADWLSRHG